MRHLYSLFVVGTEILLVLFQERARCITCFLSTLKQGAWSHTQKGCMEPHSYGVHGATLKWGASSHTQMGCMGSRVRPLTSMHPHCNGLALGYQLLIINTGWKYAALEGPRAYILKAHVADHTMKRGLIDLKTSPQIVSSWYRSCHSCHSIPTLLHCTVLPFFVLADVLCYPCEIPGRASRVKCYCQATRHSPPHLALQWLPSVTPALAALFKYEEVAWEREEEDTK